MLKKISLLLFVAAFLGLATQTQAQTCNGSLTVSLTGTTDGKAGKVTIGTDLYETEVLYCINGTATALSVAATTNSGAAPTLTYKWYSNTTNSTAGGTLIASATTNSYTPSTATAGTTYYYVVIGDGCADATSKFAKITINSSAAITTQPTNQTVCKDSTVTPLSVVATGAGLTYQWYSNTSASNAGGSPVSGATSSTFTPSSATAGAFYYYAVVTGTCSTVPSSAITLTVNPSTAITSSPVDQIVCKDSTVTPLTVAASGLAVTYQWYSNSSASNTGGTMVSGATSATFTPLSTTAGTFYYYAVATGTCGAAKSAAATFIVNPSTAITSSPADQTVCKDGSVTALTVAASGLALTYQWYSNSSASNTNGTAISGATSATFTPSSTTAGIFYYYAVATGTCGAAKSAVATFTVNASTVITSNLSTAEVKYCPTATPNALTVVATGTGTLTYAWYSNTTASTTGATAAATTATFTPTLTQGTTTYYYVIVTSSCGSVTSAFAKITVNPTLKAGTCSPTIDACQLSAGQIKVQVYGGTFNASGAKYTLGATGTYTNANAGLGSVTIAAPVESTETITVSGNSVTATNYTYSGLPGNATYTFTVADGAGCAPN